MVTANDILIFDRVLLRQRRQRRAAQFHNHDFLLQWANKQLSERLQMVKRDFPLAFNIGAGKINDPKIGHTISMDNSTLIADEEFLPFGPSTFDLIYSALNLHSVNDLPGALLQIKQSLKPDGLLVAALFGGETLFELRESLMQAELELKGGASPRVFPFADKPQMGALLQRANFTLPVVDSEIITVTYADMFGLLRDLRGMGESNIIRGRHKSNPGKMLFARAAEYYRDKFSEPEGRIRASFEIIFLSGWSPHASQQKPLTPGSAKMRLADALDTQEIRSGEQARP
jgi:NADH dehydrogenase [ubiquinone] 1 alpha subcomplex assembly factor 5